MKQKTCTYVALFVEGGKHHDMTYLTENCAYVQRLRAQTSMRNDFIAVAVPLVHDEEKRNGENALWVMK